MKNIIIEICGLRALQACSEDRLPPPTINDDGDFGGGGCGSGGMTVMKIFH